MRPLPGDEGRSRSTSFDSDATPLATRCQPPQMTYFMADEKTMEAAQPVTSITQPKPRDLRQSAYGVESLDTTISSLIYDSDEPEETARRSRRKWKRNLGQHMSRNSEEDLENAASLVLMTPSDVSGNVSPTHQRRPSQTAISRPFTPLSFGSPAPPSIISSPDSRRNSEAGSYMDDITSQAVASSEDDDPQVDSEMVNSGSAPQLVMPSIKMPSRRPFTEKGKNMGRLKVLIAGDSGIGKTSLIKAIVQVCEDIVHVDPLAPTSAPEPRRKASKTKRSGSADLNSTLEVTEIYASTRPYPAWWSDLEDSKILRRRKSMGDSVLERNLCFVDTPGYGNQTSLLECITPTIDYIESHFKKTSEFGGLSELEIVNLLSGNGGAQVDAVLYVISNRVKDVDIEYLRRLSELTNVIPLIAQADTCTSEQLSSIKEQILSELETANIRPFLFGLTNEAARHSPHPTVPYAISTRPSKDHENMDASLLMSPDYVQPLLESELHILVAQMFERDTIAWLRHSAAKKFLSWRSSTTPLAKPMSLYRPLASAVTPSQVLTAPDGATTSYALARITDHTQREERLAQVRLANWAADLQRSLQNERSRFEALARSERAVWLTERLGECVFEGTIVPISDTKKMGLQYDAESGALVTKETYYRRPQTQIQGGVNPSDPCGLLMYGQSLKHTGWLALKFVSSFGLAGGLVFWAIRRMQDTEVAAWGLGIRDWVELGAIDWNA